MSSQKDFLFEGSLVELDPDVSQLTGYEETRQHDKLLMIASESICPKPVRDALASVFSNKYAEGYASVRMSRLERGRVEKEIDRYTAFHRRYGDRRFYKGGEYVNVIEVLAQRRAAELFANARVSADEIFVNVQPLSGAAANNAVYNAFVMPGDTVMGMALSYGGHLTHGSPFNRSGRFHKIIPYGVDMATGQLDYDEIKRLALEHKPKLIIAGASAYPWGIDWAKLRAIADAVPVSIPGRAQAGAILVADISHPSGLAVAGLFPNPVGYADVTTLTTHKTLCGPRGAIIITTDRAMAQRIDFGVFPGEQGGPHINNIAAKAVCFKIAQTPAFKELQHKIVENAGVLADTFKKLGLKLAYGGTNTHMVLVDLDAIKPASGVPLKGDIASNILDICGITCNKNALPGDETGTHPRGIRLGTSMLTQRGMGPAEMKQIAQLVHKVLINIKTFKVIGPLGELARGKISLEIIEEVKAEVAKLVKSFGKRAEPAQPINKNMEIIGERATTFLQQVTTLNIFALKAGDVIQTGLLNSKGQLISEVRLQRLNDTPRHDAHYLLQTPADKYNTILTWLTGLSDGYILFDEDDLFAKIDGPVVIRETDKKVEDRKQKAESKEIQYDSSKPYFIGQRHINGKAGKTKAEFKFTPPTDEPKHTLLYEEHLKYTKKQFMIPFAGWSMPVWYTRASEEHQVVREAAGLFDVSHMGRMEIKGEYSTRFLDLVTTNFVSKLNIGDAQYSYILDPDGRVMDDIFIYYLGINRYLMVVNAANAEKIKQWLEAVNEHRVIIDRAHPDREVEGSVTITDLRPAPDNPIPLDIGTVNVALQGPRSLETLLRLTKDSRTIQRLINLKRSQTAEVELGGIKALVARTGYTGEKLGFEITTAASAAVRFWNMILDKGRDLGVRPTGLAARDSTRTEAGLPLYGHELAGTHDIIPTECGYGSFVKRHKTFFIGREAYLKREARSTHGIVRFEITAEGARTIKPHDPVVDRKGEYIGSVTSCTLVGGKQTGLAYVDKTYTQTPTRIAIFPLPAKADKLLPEKSKKELQAGDKVLLAETAQIVERFPLRQTKWISTIRPTMAAKPTQVK